MIKIKPDEELFCKWILLGKQIQDLKNIVQNHMMIKEGIFFDWRRSAEKLNEDLYELIQETDGYIVHICEWTE